MSKVKRTNHLKNWVIFFAVGQGHTQTALLSKFYIWGKKLTAQPQTSARFWVNLQVSVVLTKKPANLRMGKGKGGRVGAVAKVNPGATLLALSWLRWGRIVTIARQIQVRCNFKIGYSRPLAFKKTHYIAPKGPRRAYALTRMYELRSFFRKTNQSYQYLFVGFLFKWFKYKPFLAEYKVSSAEFPLELDPFFNFRRNADKLHLFFYWDDSIEFNDFFFEQILTDPSNDIYPVELGSSFAEWYILLNPEIVEHIEEDSDFDFDESLSDVEFETEITGLVGALKSMPNGLYKPNTSVDLQLAWEYFVVLYGLASHITKLNVFDRVI